MVPGDISDSFSSLHHGVSKWFVSESVQCGSDTGSIKGRCAVFAYVLVALKSSLKQSEEHHLASHGSFDY
jgi:hypothetical protein